MVQPGLTVLGQLQGLGEKLDDQLLLPPRDEAPDHQPDQVPGVVLHAVHRLLQAGPHVLEQDPGLVLGQVDRLTSLQTIVPQPVQG